MVDMTGCHRRRVATVDKFHVACAQEAYVIGLRLLHTKYSFVVSSAVCTGAMVMYSTVGICGKT